MDQLVENSVIATLSIISYFCDLVTYPIYMAIQKPWIKESLSNRVKAKPIAMDDNSITFRSIGSSGTMHECLIKERINTMEKAFNFAVNKYKTKNCLGTRKIISRFDETQADGKVFEKYEMAQYRWQTFLEVDRDANSFGKGLRALGLKHQEPIAIFAETRADWMIAAQACFKQNIPIVTIYATLGFDGITHAINFTEVTVIITSHSLLPTIRKILHHIPKVYVIIYMTHPLLLTDTSNLGKATVIPFSNVISVGSASKIETTPPKPEDIAIIMFTSGSGGVPKGVIISHKNLLASLKSFSDPITFESNDIFIGYLPLAHVFEFLIQSVCLLNGTPIGYSTSLTITDMSEKIKGGCKGDASVLRPTLMTAVPLVLDKIAKNVQYHVSKRHPVERAIFKFAYYYKKKHMRNGFDTWLMDRLVFNKTAQVMGGQIKIISCGGAPLSSETQEFIKITLCTQVLQGYGLTESTSSGLVMDVHDLSLGRVGMPVIGCDVKLINWEDGNYMIKDEPYPRGELTIGGDNISSGYFKLPDKNEDFFEEAGKRWVRTGDIAEVHPDGCFKIIDRKKDMIKLQAGEYVALGKVEAVLLLSPIIDNICVHANPNKIAPVALIVPNAFQLRLLINDVTTPLDTLCRKPEVEAAVLKSIREWARNQNLEKFEIPAAVKLCKETWTPESGLVTASMKLRRREIHLRYKSEIDEMYASLE